MVRIMQSHAVSAVSATVASTALHIIGRAYMTRGILSIGITIMIRSGTAAGASALAGAGAGVAIMAGTVLTAGIHGIMDGLTMAAAGMQADTITAAVMPAAQVAGPPARDLPQDGAIAVLKAAELLASDVLLQQALTIAAA